MFKTNANTAPQVNGVRVNQSVYGSPIPFLFGRARLLPKLIWQNDFDFYMTNQGKKGKNAQAITQSSPG